MWLCLCDPRTRAHRWPSLRGPCPRLAPVLPAPAPSSLFFPPPSDYGFERSSASSSSDANKCFANFWFNPQSPPDDCVLGQTYTSSLG